MRNIKILVFGVVLIGLGSQSLLAQHTSHVRFSFIDVLNFTVLSKSDIAIKIDKDIYNGKLTVYSDKKLSNKMSIKQYHKLLEVSEDIKIPNPKNPNDINDLLDSIVFYYPRIFDFKLIGKEVLEFENTKGENFYISYKHLKNHIDKRLQSVLNYCMEKKFTIIMKDENLLGFCKQQVSQVGKTLYDYGLDSMNSSYRDDSLKYVYSVNEILDRITLKENRAIPNPDNPNDINDLIDTVIKYPFNFNSTKFIQLYFSFETKEATTNAKVIAIAPMFRGIAAGLELPILTAFIVRETDFNKILTKNERVFWQHFYSFMLQNRSSGGYYNSYDENYLPSGN